MNWLGVAEIVVILVALAIVIPLVWLYLRRRWLSRQGGMVDCSLRLHQRTPGSGWFLGCARYQGKRFEWFKIFTLRLKPQRVFEQGEWTASNQRQPNQTEAMLLFEDQVIITLTSRNGQNVDMAIDQQSLTGFLSWLESAGPGEAHYGYTVE